MRFKIGLVLILALLTACNPFIGKELRNKNKANRALEKVLKRYPQLAVQDTIHDTVTVLVPEIVHDTVIETNNDVSGVDSILSAFRIQLDSVSHLELTQEIKNYVIERPVIKDTLYYEFPEVTIKLFNQDGNIGLNFKVHEREIEKATETVVQKAMMQKLTAFEELTNNVAKWGWRFFWLVLILVVIYTAWKILKKFFPFLDFFA